MEGVPCRSYSHAFNHIICRSSIGRFLRHGAMFWEQWVDNMLAQHEHDFGTVARGADTVYKFPIKNIYTQDVRLVSVHASCGCTTPTLENTTLKTGDIGYIVATFNTRTFSGVHAATLTLTATWDENGVRRQGEAQVHVDGNIRTDIVFLPGEVKFGAIDQGSKAEERIRVIHAGQADWKITDVRHRRRLRSRAE